MTDESYNENEERKRPGIERVYRNDQIAVSWEPKLCIHVGNCFRGLPEVFKPQSRPWISVDAGTADKITDVVMTCPTRSEEHTSELQSQSNLVCRLLLEKKKQ